MKITSSYQEVQVSKGSSYLNCAAALYHYALMPTRPSESEKHWQVTITNHSDNQLGKNNSRQSSPVLFSLPLQFFQDAQIIHL